MLKHTLLAGLATACTLAFAASAQAAYLSLGTSNTSSFTTTLKGNTAGPELQVWNANGSTAAAFSLYGLHTATSPTVTSSAVRGENKSTNGHGYGVWGSQAGSGTGVFGYARSGRGVWGSSDTGIGVKGSSPTGGVGVRGSSHSGMGALGEHTASTGSAPGVEGLTNSTDASAVAVRGQNESTTANGYGVWGSKAGGSGGVGVYGTAPGGVGVRGDSSYVGVYGASGPSGITGVEGDSSNAYGVRGISTTSTGVEAASSSGDALNANSATGRGILTTTAGSGDAIDAGSAGGIGLFANTVSGTRGVIGTLANASCPGAYAVGGCGTNVGYGVYGNSSSYGVYGNSSTSDGVHGIGATAGVAGSVGASGDGVYGETTGTSCTGSCFAGYFYGDVHVTGAITAGVKDFQVDDPLDPAHKYLQHTSVESSQMLDIYNGNVTTNGKGFATVRMPKWFQALNRTFRYQLTVIDRAHWTARAAVWDKIAHNRFTIRTDQAHVQVSWQVTGIRHDPYANANRTRVVVPKPKADQGKYVHPELYGKPKTDGIGYRKPPRAPRTTHKR
jgi:hypothetical protein